jgi:DNA-binding transcriptional ArsR family regulator
MYEQIKVLGNKHRYDIVKLTQEEELSISDLSQKLSLAYSKTVDYVKMLEDVDLIEKRKEGKNVYVKAKIKDIEI